MSETPDLNLSSILSLFPGRVAILLSLHTTHTGVSSTLVSLSSRNYSARYESRKTAPSARQRSRKQRILYMSEKILVLWIVRIIHYKEK